jgi:pyruvate dehydrogenase E1 component alpha subunit
MRTIREFEERVRDEFAAGSIPGAVHLYAGQESCAAGVCAHLTPLDYVASTHRGHGHCIAKGVDVGGMMAELFGRATGICHGKGGSMHVADLDLGMLGANGIVAAGLPLACGAALASKYRGDGRVAVAFLGDGATNQGTACESFNLAKIWQLPVIFVIEDNGYAEATASRYAIGAESNVIRARGFGLPAEELDGNDFFAVYQAADTAVARARSGGGPTVLDCKVVRYCGHFEGDEQAYRASREVELAREAGDCIEAFAHAVVDSGQVQRHELTRVDEVARERIAAAIAAAKAAPHPAPEELFKNVYATY